MIARYTNFEWEAAPLSHWQWPALSVVLYLIVVALLSSYMKSRAAFNLRLVTVGHNTILSLGSLVMFLGTAFELQRRYAQSGTAVWFCCESATKSSGPLYFWSYVYYLSKFYEMLDTVFVLLQKSRVPHFGLQVYHHAAVVPMAWLWCEQQQSLQWGGLLFNTLVHVIMYQYYACKVLGWPTPWKRWITKLQIVQFLTSFVLLTLTIRFLSQGASCAGMPALLYNCIFNATLLLQFVGVDSKNTAQQKGK
jgi:fatty acid elongase 3